MKRSARVIFLANTDWYLYNFRLALARRLRSEGIEVVMMSPPGEYGAKLRAAGFRWEPVPMERRSLNPRKEIRLIVHLVKRFRAERPQLVHGFTIKCVVYGSIAARLAGVRARVGAIAGLGYVFASHTRAARLLRPLVRGLLRVALGGRGLRLILQNPDDLALLGDARIVGYDRVRLIPGSGVDCQRFSPRPDVGGRHGPLRVLLAARLLWEKGVAEYVEAARLLLAEGRPIRFLLAGMPDPGNPASVPVEKIESWVREGLVEWLGHVDEMAELLREMDVLVHPSYYREGVPRTLIEGAASGLPLVTTDTPGCREVVTDGVDGLLVPARDAPALARAIARLQDDPELARRLGEASRAKALAQFDERLVFDRTLAVYKELLPELTHDGDGLIVEPGKLGTGTSTTGANGDRPGREQRPAGWPRSLR